jgi:hypothetical protein
VNLRVAATAFVGSAALVVVTAWRAIRLDDVRPLEAAAPVAADAAPAETPGDGYSLTRILAALDKDPFHPARRRPAHRLQVPGGNDVVPIVAERGLMVQVIGTAVAADGSGFAMCAWGGAPPRIVRIGERVGDWTLRSVTPGAAEFTSPTGATTVVRIAKVGEGS